MERKPKRKEEYLLNKGGRFGIPSGSKKCQVVGRKSPAIVLSSRSTGSSTLLGIRREIKGKEQKCPDFFSVDYSGQAEELQPLRLPRVGSSLSGLASQLTVFGGQKRKCLEICEKYKVSRNKWCGLPPLNTPRLCQASVLLQSLKAFCFCGISEKGTQNSIESLQTDTDAKWTAHSINNKIPQIYYLVAVSFQSQVAVFGGELRESYYTLVFSEEAELVEDLSEDTLIPGQMLSGTYAVEENQIFALGYKELPLLEAWRVGAFDGKKWCLCA